MSGAGLEGIERRVFVASAGALVGDEVGDWIADVASTFVARLPAAERRLLSGLLRSLEVTGPFLAGRWGQFTGLTRDERARTFARLSAGPGRMRQAVAALRALALLCCYGSPQGWRHARYDGPWLGRREVPVLPPPMLREAGTKVPPWRSARVIHGRQVGGDLRTKAEVCVIGSGAGGAAAAARLAAEGADVLVIEAGGYTTAQEFTQRELEMLPLLYQDGGMRATSDRSIGILQGKGVGGSTLHNTGLVYEAPAGILERWRAGHGFPFGEREWRRLVDDATGTLGARAIPLDRLNPNNQALRRGASVLGWRHTVARHNRVECSGCGYCMLGCAYNRKLNASLTWIPSALEDDARVLTDARALSIGGIAGERRIACALLDAEGRPTGRRAEVAAKVVILAAGALDSPALLLRSGLGGARVGRALRLHPTPLVYAEMPEPVVAWRGLPQAVIVEEFATFAETGRGGFLLLPSAGTAPAIAALGAPGMGAAHRELMGRYDHLAIGAVLPHDETEGRVGITRDGRPVARYWPDADDTRTLLRGIRALAQLYLAAGARRVWLPFPDVPALTTERQIDEALVHARVRPHSIGLNSVHPQGTCAIGAHAGTSATGPYGELWNEPGIYVADASLFPTSVGTPPQVTVMALASGVASHIAAERL